MTYSRSSTDTASQLTVCRNNLIRSTSSTPPQPLTVPTPTTLDAALPAELEVLESDDGRQTTNTADVRKFDCLEVASTKFW